MKYTITLSRNSERIGTLSEIDYASLEIFLLDYFKAERIFFNHQEPLPGTVTAEISTPNGVYGKVYEKIEVKALDAGKELLKHFMENIPFDLNDVEDLNDVGNGKLVVELKDKQYLLGWRKLTS